MPASLSYLQMRHLRIRSLCSSPVAHLLVVHVAGCLHLPLIMISSPQRNFVLNGQNCRIMNPNHGRAPRVDTMTPLYIQSVPLSESTALVTSTCMPDVLCPLLLCHARFLHGMYGVSEREANCTELAQQVAAFKVNHVLPSRNRGWITF